MGQMQQSVGLEMSGYRTAHPSIIDLFLTFKSEFEGF